MIYEWDERNGRAIVQTQAQSDNYLIVLDCLSMIPQGEGGRRQFSLQPVKKGDERDLSPLLTIGESKSHKFLRPERIEGGTEIRS